MIKPVPAGIARSNSRKSTMHPVSASEGHAFADAMKKPFQREFGAENHRFSEPTLRSDGELKETEKVEQGLVEKIYRTTTGPELSATRWTKFSRARSRKRWRKRKQVTRKLLLRYCRYPQLYRLSRQFQLFGAQWVQQKTLCVLTSCPV